MIARDLPELAGEGAEVLVAELPHQGVLVREVEVDRRGRVLDPLGDPPHRDGVVALVGEELPGRVEDPRPKLLLLPLPSFGCTQNVPPLVNYVNLTTKVLWCQ